MSGLSYGLFRGHDFRVTLADLAPIGAAATAPEAPDPRVDLAAQAIRGVPASEAIALRVGERILLYAAIERRSLGELCRYSPSAAANPLNEGKPEQAIPKIVDGRLQGFYKDIALLEQPYAKDDKKAIKDLLGSATVVRYAQVTIG